MRLGTYCLTLRRPYCTSRVLTYRRIQGLFLLIDAVTIPIEFHGDVNR
jgi:hypothetical protein